jgi:hypothetical protein
MRTNIPDLYYVACWTEDDGIYHCGHKHQSLVDAMKCVFPDGGTFVRACEAASSARSATSNLCALCSR